MNKINAFFRTYKYELLSFLINLTISWIAFHFINSLIIFLVSSFIFTLSVFLVIFFKTREKDFFYLPMDKPSSKRNWVGRGKFYFVENENCFEITESHVGYIFPKTTDWDDYSFIANFKIVNKTLAWIVRAADLSNYIMFQFEYNGINPHIRINGNWIVKKHTASDVNLTFQKELNPDTWYKAKIVCEKRSVRIVIYKGQSAIFDRHWKIPEQMIVEYERFSEDKLKKEKYVQNIDFDFGAIGFRNHGDERGFIKNVHLQRLRR